MLLRSLRGERSILSAGSPPLGTSEIAICALPWPMGVCEVPGFPSKKGNMGIRWSVRRQRGGRGHYPSISQPQSFPCPRTTQRRCGPVQKAPREPDMLAIHGWTCIAFEQRFQSHLTPTERWMSRCWLNKIIFS